ncbi:MAG TPA: caspase family protein, partial [Myxococcota bacterium]|nr:caspase family protein [Myxococcota bacterium]
MPSHRDPIRALIIGVADYPALDPAQTALGADHDAVAWSAIARALGYRTDQIFVRRSPPLSKSISAPYLPPAENRKGAKAAKVLKAIQKLINSLRADPGGRGLLVYSGHGTVINGKLHLCPEDTAWENGSLVNTISIDQILDMIGDALPGLTVVLDCCFAGALEGSGGAGIPA